MVQQANPRHGPSSSWLRLAAILVILAIGLYSAWQRQRRPGLLPPGLAPTPRVDHAPEPSAATEIKPEGDRGRATERSHDVSALQTRIVQQTIRDRDGRVVFRGDVDLGRTLDRIERGERVEFSHDGMTFENRERRLPRQPPGYYHEYVHPTPRLGGPGPQRIVIGRGGEVYYTPDHYRTFMRLDRP